MSTDDTLPDEEVWEASGGVRIPLGKMSDKHLRNAANYVKKALREVDNDHFEESDEDDLIAKLDKLEGEVARRLNEEPQSLPITETRRQADEAYRRLQR